MSDFIDYMDRKEPCLEVGDLPMPFQAKIVPYGRSGADQRFPLADVVVHNAWNRSEDVVIEVCVGNSKRSTIQSVAPHGDIEVTLKASDLQFPDGTLVCGITQSATVTVKDGVGRSVISQGFRFRSVDDSSRPEVTAEIRSTEPYLDRGVCTIGYVEFESDTDVLEVCTVRISSGGEYLQSQDVNVVPDCLSSHQLALDAAAMGRVGSKDLAVEVVHGGRRIAAGIIRASDGTFPRGGVPGARSIFAQCTYKGVADIHDFTPSGVEIGKVSVTNRTQSETRVRIMLEMGGENVENRVVTIGPLQTYGGPLTIPVTMAVSVESRLAEFRCFVLDRNEMPVFSRNGAVEIRSQFDMDLSKRNLRTAQFVNPGASGIKEFAISNGSPLSRAMGEGYAITGYSNPEKIIPQLSGIYGAAVSLGMNYVHDSLFPSGFQRVRSPTQVLKDRNGDCMELSVFFGSVFERVGFEPVIVFVPGHAMVGIVVSTDMYQTDSVMPDTMKDMVVRVETGGGHYFSALLIESTYCAYANTDLAQACLRAKENASAHLRYIADSNYVLIGKERKAGTRPTMASVPETEV